MTNIENTIDRIVIISNGFSNVHKTPKTDFRYFIFTSLATNSYNNGWNFLKFSKYRDMESPLLPSSIQILWLL